MIGQEEWRAVDGAVGYEVSSIGRVRSWRKSGRVSGRREVPRMLRGSLDRDGYLRCHFRIKPHIRLVHRLVLEAFVGPCPPGMECRHFPDRARTNNRLENLSWGTPLENHQDKVFHGTVVHAVGVRNGTRTSPLSYPRGGERSTARLTEGSAIVIQMLSGLPLHERPTSESVGAVFRVSGSVVKLIMGGKLWKHIGGADRAAAALARDPRYARTRASAVTSLVGGT